MLYIHSFDAVAGRFICQFSVSGQLQYGWFGVLTSPNSHLLVLINVNVCRQDLKRPSVRKLVIWSVRQYMSSEIVRIKSKVCLPQSVDSQYSCHPVRNLDFRTLLINDGGTVRQWSILIFVVACLLFVPSIHWLECPCVRRNDQDVFCIREILILF